MKVFITGATGFIGSHLVSQCLDRGWNVTAVKRANSNLDAFHSVEEIYKQTDGNSEGEEIQRIQQLKESLKSLAEWQCNREINPTAKGKLDWISLSIDDIDQIKEALKTPYDLIIHAAAQISFKKSDGPRMIEDNIQLARNVVNAALINGQKKLIHVSSIAALGRPTEDRPIQITDAWEESDYNTDYAKSKYHSELEVWRGKEEGLDVLIVNPGIVLGYAAGYNSYRRIVDAVIKGNPFIPAGSNGFVFVEELACRTLNLSQETSNWNQRYLMVSHNLQYETLLKQVARVYSTKPPKWKLEGLLFNTVYRLVSALEFMGIHMSVSTELLKSTRKKSVYLNP